MRITDKHLQELLQEQLSTGYTANKFHENKHYKWFIAYFEGTPVFVIRYHKSAKYFCNVVSLLGGINPIDTYYITKASERLEEELDENKLNRI